MSPIIAFRTRIRPRPQLKDSIFHKGLARNLTGGTRMPEFDIAVFGATGFTGRMASTILCEDPKLKIILAGRDLSKLEATQARCRHRPSIRKVDALDKSAVSALVRDAK